MPWLVCQQRPRHAACSLAAPTGPRMQRRAACRTASLLCAHPWQPAPLAPRSPRAAPPLLLPPPAPAALPARRPCPATWQHCQQRPRPWPQRPPARCGRRQARSRQRPGPLWQHPSAGAGESVQLNWRAAWMGRKWSSSLLAACLPIASRQVAPPPPAADAPPPAAAPCRPVRPAADGGFMAAVGRAGAPVASCIAPRSHSIPANLLFSPWPRPLEQTSLPHANTCATHLHLSHLPSPGAVVAPFPLQQRLQLSVHRLRCL